MDSVSTYSPMGDVCYGNPQSIRYGDFVTESQIESTAQP